MTITQAIAFADSEHVVYFLLSAYVESLDFYDAAHDAVPPQVKALPLKGRPDVNGRLKTLRQRFQANGGRGPDLLREAVDVFGAAVDRLDALEGFARRSPCEDALAARRRAASVNYRSLDTNTRREPCQLS